MLDVVANDQSVINGFSSRPLRARPGSKLPGVRRPRHAAESPVSPFADKKLLPVPPDCALDADTRYLLAISCELTPHALRRY